MPTTSYQSTIASATNFNQIGFRRPINWSPPRKSHPLFFTSLRHSITTTFAIVHDATADPSLPKARPASEARCGGTGMLISFARPPFSSSMRPFPSSLPSASLFDALRLQSLTCSNTRTTPWLGPSPHPPPLFVTRANTRTTTWSLLPLPLMIHW